MNIKRLNFLGIPLLFVIFLSVLLFFLSPKNVFATSGCCSWHGGQSYCDYSTGRWVCADGTYSPSCTCGSGYQYTPPPSCPSMSNYDSISGKCKCYSGYVSNGSSCISNLQWCWNNYGYNSTYDYTSGGCKCSYGYVMSGDNCISGNSYCWNKYGYNSTYDNLKSTCGCKSGYTWNQGGTSCISNDSACQNQLGLMSRYNSLDDVCECLSGYTIQSGSCQLEQKRIIPIIYKNNNHPTPTDTPIPTVMEQKYNNTLENVTPTIDITQFKKGSSSNSSIFTKAVDIVANLLTSAIKIFFVN